MPTDDEQRAAADAPETAVPSPAAGSPGTFAFDFPDLLQKGQETRRWMSGEDGRRRVEQLLQVSESARHLFLRTIDRIANRLLRQSGEAALGISPRHTISGRRQALDLVT